MTTFEFVSYESYPEDEYTKESVTLCIAKQHRVTYVRKKMQNGGMFWDVISASVKKGGEKKYLKSYAQDSNFLHEDIKAFLDNREWEKNSNGSNSGGNVVESKSDDGSDLPF